MNNMKKNRVKEENQKGQGLLEVLVALGVFMIGIASIGFMYVSVMIGSGASMERMKAGFLATEGMEAVRSYHRYSEMEEGDYFLDIENGKWVLRENGAETVNGYQRIVIVETEEDIGESGSSGKMVTVKVEWSDVLLGDREMELKEIFIR